MKVKLHSNTVCTGFSSSVNDYIEGEIDLNKYLIKNSPATFIVRSQGESMMKSGIHSGDLLIVDRSIKLKNNSIVIASINGDLTVKRIKILKKKFLLTSDSKDYPGIELDIEADLSVWGVVTNVIHNVY